MPRIYTNSNSAPVAGVLQPGMLLTKEGAWSCAGMGRDQLLKARKSGIVRPIKTDKRIYYRSSELIAWIESHAERADLPQGNASPETR